MDQLPAAVTRNHFCSSLSPGFGVSGLVTTFAVYHAFLSLTTADTHSPDTREGHPYHDTLQPCRHSYSYHGRDAPRGYPGDAIPWNIPTRYTIIYIGMIQYTR